MAKIVSLPIVDTTLQSFAASTKNLAAASEAYRTLEKEYNREWADNPNHALIKVPNLFTEIGGFFHTAATAQQAGQISLKVLTFLMVNESRQQPELQRKAFAAVYKSVRHSRMRLWTLLKLVSMKFTELWMLPKMSITKMARLKVNS